MHAPVTRSRFDTMPEPSAQDPADGDALDVELMRRVATGDERAFRRLVERHQHAVVGMIAKMLSDSSEAEDLAQRAFLRVWKHAPRWRPDAKFTTYLFTIVRNLVYNETRRRSRRKEVSADERAEDGGRESTADPRGQPDAEAERQESAAEIDAVLASLPEAQRLAVVLYAYESLSYEEIAEVLGSSVSSVKSLMFRARATLRERLGHLMNY